MKRILLRLVVALVTAGLLVAPAVAALSADDVVTDAKDPVSVSSYAADFLVVSDGGLVGKETVTAQFPSGRHGIYRYWDVTDPSDAHVRLDPHDISVTLDGREVPFELSWERGRRVRVATIGDADTTLDPGQHVYTITYRIDGAVSPGTGAGSPSVFDWNVVAPGWEMSMATTTSTIRLPAPSARVRCTAGRDGAAPCEMTGAGTDAVVVGTGAHAPRTPVTVRIGLPVATPDRVTVPWTVAWDGVLGRSEIAVVALLTLSVVALLLGYWLDRRSREDEPSPPMVHGPPTGLGPVQTAYVVEETVPPNALVATLLNQAELGLTELTRTDDGHWTIVGTGSAADWATTDAVTRYVGEELGVASLGGTFSADQSVESGETLQAARIGIWSATSTWAEEIGVRQKSRIETYARMAVFAAFVLAVVVGFGLPATVYGLPFATFAIGGIGLTLKGIGTRRTAVGRRLWSEALGLRRMLSTPEASQRFRTGIGTDRYTGNIAFAVALGCADSWAKKYETETGTRAPLPLGHVGGDVGVGSGSTSANFSAFESSLSSSMSSYAATQSSSSGGGGGESGGGGGGGGSW